MKKLLLKLISLIVILSLGIIAIHFLGLDEKLKEAVKPLLEKCCCKCSCCKSDCNNEE